jgi:adenylosuccinate lyase
MQLNQLTAISPIDGRYRKGVEPLANYFSEFALIKYRVLVEIEYFIALCELPLPQLQHFDKSLFNSLRNVYQNFSEADAEKIKNLESVTNHDVKAVEYFLKEKMTELNIDDAKEFIHFGLTSQDINNTAIPLSIKNWLHEIYLPQIQKVVDVLKSYASDWSDITMLAHTHGQPASPTKLGKEIMVFVERLENQIQTLPQIPMAAKFGGATGNFNAHHISYSNINWKDFANNFVNNNLGLKRMQFTTQIEHYDSLAALFDNLRRINIILIDCCRDIWQYIAMEYFKQKTKKDEVGSSAMPHKVNPIDFENAEGNLGLANALLGHLSEKLPISRLQRDLTDSTVLRNVGVPAAHIQISINSFLKGLSKLLLNERAIENHLEKNWMIVAEAIQTVLRRENYPAPYEALKALTRGAEHINQQSIHDFIDALQVSDEIKNELKNISPFNYSGI